uniref:Uncharacterized protein n=1 Tax=Populus alba TaxID=43335 RepID=A0A4U5Q6W4_POPAL|nr:hypothetical protein D5086_0000127540 [Populus alba]
MKQICLTLGSEACALIRTRKEFLEGSTQRMGALPVLATKGLFAREALRLDWSPSTSPLSTRLPRREELSHGSDFDQASRFNYKLLFTRFRRFKSDLAFTPKGRKPHLRASQEQSKEQTDST